MKNDALGATGQWIPRSIDIITRDLARAAIAGWIVGLCYYNWLADIATPIPWWGHFLLATLGSMASVILVGLVVGLPIVGITKLLNGRGARLVDALGISLAAIFAFLAADIAIHFVERINYFASARAVPGPLAYLLSRFGL